MATARLSLLYYSSPAAGSYVELKLFGSLVRFTAMATTNRAKREFGIRNGFTDAAAELRYQIAQYLADNGPEIYDFTHEVYLGDRNVEPPELGYQAFHIQAETPGSTYNFSGSHLTGNVIGNDPHWFLAFIDSDAEALSVTAQTGQVMCFGGASGTIQLNITGGRAPYYVTWDDGSTSTFRDVLPAGAYTVNVLDSRGQSAKLVVQVGQNTPIQVTGTKEGGSITQQVSGGVGPYTYLWNDGATTKDRSNLENGFYVCTITDSLGCSNSFSYSLQIDKFYFSRNPITLPLFAGSPHTKPNLTFLCEVWVEEDYLSGNFTKVTEDPLEHPADKQGRTVFDVKRFLDVYVQPHFPAFGQTSVMQATKAFKRFFLKYTEKYGVVPQPSSFSQIDIRYVLCGGLDRPEEASQVFFDSYLPSRKPFFTWEPAVKEAFVLQPEFLYYMHNTFDETSFQVKVKVYFADNTTATFLAYDQANVLRYELYAIPVGFSQLGLASKKPGATVLRWDVYVTNAAGQILSETRRFILNTRYFRRVQYLLYGNSLGGINTLVCTGQSRRRLDPESQQLEKIIPLDFKPEEGEVIVREKYLKQKLELSTGYRPAREIAALQDFVLSRDVLLVGHDRHHAGYITDKDVVINDEAEDFSYIDFEFNLPKQFNFTPALRLSGYGAGTTGTEPAEPLAP